MNERQADTSFEELLTEFLEQEAIWHFEGSQGTKNLERVIQAIGYERDYLSDAITNFLEDNPGAIEAVIRWIEKTADPAWKENLTSHLDEKEEEAIEEELERLEAEPLPFEPDEAE